MVFPSRVGPRASHLRASDVNAESPPTRTHSNQATSTFVARALEVRPWYCLSRGPLKTLARALEECSPSGKVRGSNQ